MSAWLLPFTDTTCRLARVVISCLPALYPVLPKLPPSGAHPHHPALLFCHNTPSWTTIARPHLPAADLDYIEFLKLLEEGPEALPSASAQLEAQERAAAGAAGEAGAARVTPLMEYLMEKYSANPNMKLGSLKRRKAREERDAAAAVAASVVLEAGKVGVGIGVAGCISMRGMRCRKAGQRSMACSLMLSRMCIYNMVCSSIMAPLTAGRGIRERGKWSKIVIWRGQGSGEGLGLADEAGHGR